MADRSLLYGSGVRANYHCSDCWIGFRTLSEGLALVQ